ncbi:MAG: ABC transporter permease, partial [Bacteroidales bacterium]|nr:ABC transporter permease [Bacteroidales bacterium]
LQYDRFHHQSESIYLATTEMKDNAGNIITFPETPTILAQELRNKVPAIEHSFHFMYLYGKRIIKSGNNSFEETGIAADSEMLAVFNFPLIEGDINFLDDPDAIFITEKLAKKLFSNEMATGKVVMYRKEKALTVKGVIKDIPENSSLKFDFIVPYQIEMGNNLAWWPVSDATFIKIDANTDIAKTKQMASAIWRENVAEKQYGINFIPITKLRYGADFDVFNAQHGNYLKLYSFIGIALLILILASLNYTNLVSAYSMKRVGEVGIRKVNGASSGNILKYFLAESVIHSMIASSLAIVLSMVFIRLFQMILDVNLASKYLIISYISGTIGSLIIVGIILGLYPAFITSSFSIFPKNLRNNSSPHQNKLRNAFVLSQFVLSITLTIVCLVIIIQTNYLNKFDVGYDSHNVVRIYMPPQGIKDFETIKNDLLSNPNIEQVSFAGASPVNLSSFFAAKNWEWEGLKKGASTSIYRLMVDHTYLDVFQIPLLKGRAFSASKTDKDKVIINEKLAGLLGFNDPVGKIVRQGGNNFEIIGVVKNFHFQSLSNNIQPLLFMYSDKENRMFVKISHNTTQSLDAIKKQFAQFYDQPFSYNFVDDDLKELYINESKISLGMLVFTILAIILSCIGLIGLVTFNIESKTKEVGVRKVCGAKITEIIVLLNENIIKWFLVGFLVSCILSWFLMSKWLENFAFRITLSWWIFISGAFMVLMITALTVSWQTWKAASTNPVDSLKYE